MFRRTALLLLGLALAGSAAAADADRSIRIGGNDVISEPVHGSLTAIGGNVTVTAPVSGPAQLVGGKVTIASGTAISGDASVAGGDVTIDGSVGGRLHVAGGKVRLNGPVAGDASVAAGTLELGPDARIQGKLSFRGGDLHQDPAAQVGGGVEHVASRARWHNHTHGDRFLHGWVWTMGLMVLAAILAAALPGPSNRMAAELREHPGATLLLGFLAFVGIPIAGVLLMITIIGIPIALIALMAYGVLLVVGYAWLAGIVGGMLLDRVKPEVAALAAWRAGAAVLAMLVIALLARVPYVGGLAHLVALILGIGMIAAVIHRHPHSPQASPA
jgi:hypothetical protein